MKIETKYGNLLDVSEGHIVHGCNAQGVMGAGVALAVKQKWPHAFKDYRSAYEQSGLALGTIYPSIISQELMLWHAITQDGFGFSDRNCSYDAIQTCFGDLDIAVKEMAEAIKPEVHIPMIGAGLGGGNWNIIKTIIEETLTFPTTLWILK